MLLEASRNVSAHALPTEGVSTRVRASDRVLGHLFHAYSALEYRLDVLKKLDTLCGELAVFIVKLTL